MTSEIVENTGESSFGEAQVKQIRSECAAMATYIVEVHAIDLRSLFLALHKIEQCGIDRPIPKAIYKMKCCR